MTTDINTSDEELEALMAELEAQNDEIARNSATVAAQEPGSAVSTETTAPAKSPAEEPDTVAVCESPTDASQDALGEDELAALEAELEQAGAAGVPVVPAEVSEPVKAVSEPEPVPAAVERRVVQDESGNVIQPAASFNKPEPARPTEAVGPGGLQHYVDVDQFKDDTRVTEATLDACMIEQNGLRAYYGAVAARAEAQAARVKAKFEVVEATLYDHHRKELAKLGEKTTEKMVENAVKLDPRWLKAKNMVIEADTIAAINKGLVESIKDRRDMIIQLGADRRDEYKGAARVLAEQQERDELRERAKALAAQAGRRSA